MVPSTGLFSSQVSSDPITQKQTGAAVTAAGADAGGGCGGGCDGGVDSGVGAAGFSCGSDGATVPPAPDSYVMQQPTELAAAAQVADEGVTLASIVQRTAAPAVPTAAAQVTNGGNTPAAPATLAAAAQLGAGGNTHTQAAPATGQEALADQAALHGPGPGITAAGHIATDDITSGSRSGRLHAAVQAADRAAAAAAHAGGIESADLPAAADIIAGPSNVAAARDVSEVALVPPVASPNSAGNRHTRSQQQQQHGIGHSPVVSATHSPNNRLSGSGGGGSSIGGGSSSPSYSVAGSTMCGTATQEDEQLHRELLKIHNGGIAGHYRCLSMYTCVYASC